MSRKRTREIEADIQEALIPKSLSNTAVPVRKVPTPPFPKDLFKLHTLAAFFGPRGSGKTNGAVLLALKYLQYGSFTRVFVVSPTYESNPVFEVLNVQPEDVYTDLTTILSSISSIVSKIEEDANAYNEELAYAELYLRWVNGEELTFPEQLEIQRQNHREPEPLPKPYPLVIIDDCSHSQIYSTSRSNPFINLCLRHRHIGGEGFGCSIFMLVQNFKTGVPKPIRQNLQQFFIWRTADGSQLEAMWEEFANLIDFDTFSRLYHLAVDDDKHNFLTVDMNPVQERNGHFRRNFDTTLIVRNREEILRERV